MTDPAPVPPAPTGSLFSVKNVLLTALPLALALGAVAGYFYFNAQKAQQEKVSVGGSIKTSMDVPTKLAAALQDADGDLVADAPADASKLLDPAELVFATLESNDAKAQKIWADFATHLKAKTGKNVKVIYGSFINVSQLEQLRDGQVHLAQLSTGNVPSAVNVGGFVPVCATADDAGNFTFQVELIVPAKSGATSLKDLRGKTIGLANFRSHSGFKYPLVKLWTELSMLPERDFQWSYIGRYDIGLERIARGTLDAMAVPGDYLKRYLAETPVEEKKELSEEDGKPLERVRLSREGYKTLATSEESFPGACFGHVHQLKPELAAKVKEAFLSFSIKGSSLEPEYRAAGQTRFAPIEYKKHWESIRRVDELMMKFVQVTP